MKNSGFHIKKLEEGHTSKLCETQERILGFEDKIEELDHSAKESIKYKTKSNSARHIVYLGHCKNTKLMCS